MREIKATQLRNNSPADPLMLFHHQLKRKTQLGLPTQPPAPNCHRTEVPLEFTQVAKYNYLINDSCSRKVALTSPEGNFIKWLNHHLAEKVHYKSLQEYKLSVLDDRNLNLRLITI